MGMHQGSVLSPFLFSLVVDVVTEFTREGTLSYLLYIGDLVLMSDSIEGLLNKFFKLKEDFESKGLKVILGRTMVLVSCGITNDGLSKSKVDTCGFCCLSVKVSSVLCIQCGKWIHVRCARLKMVTPMFVGNFTC